VAIYSQEAKTKVSVKVNPLRTLGAKITVNRVTLFAARHLSQSIIFNKACDSVGRVIKNNFMSSYVFGGLRDYGEEKVSLSDAIKRHNENIENRDQNRKAYDLLKAGEIEEFNRIFEGKTDSLGLSGVILKRVNLSGVVDLEGMDLRGAILKRVNLSGVNLAGVNLKLAKLFRVDLSEADLMGANIRGAKLRNLNFNGADIKGADLRDSNLSRVGLEGADLSGANFSGAKFSGVTFDESTDFTAAIVVGAKGVPERLIKEFWLKI